MKPGKAVSQKHTIVSKNNSRIILAATVASALVAFTIVGGRAMLSQISYQRRVVAKQHQAIDQLKADQNALNTLLSQYKIFNSANPNMLGVTSSGTSGDEGTNARLVLDALPSQYDFPALTSSLEKILSGRGLTPQAINGTDTGATVSVSPSSASPKPQPMQFTFSVNTTYPATKDLLSDFQRSIRPFKVITLDLAGSDSRLVLSATMETYYQPTKILSITNMEVK